MIRSRLAINDGKLVKKSSHVAATSATVAKMARQQVSANAMGGGLGGSYPTSVMGFGGPVHNTTFLGILPEYNENMLLTYYRDCYYYDSIAGSTVDILSTFPFSEYTLTGVENKHITKFSESMARIDMRGMMQEVSLSYLVDGAFIGSLIYDRESNGFQDVLIHDMANANITQQPLYALDPAISVNTTNVLNEFMNSGSPYVEQIMRSYPQGVIETFMRGSVVLDPVTTLFMPRRALRDRTHSSYLKRLLPVYLLEKLLYRGTLTEATKRLRATTHITAGDDTWEPNNAELQTILADFQRSELDPLGAWLITRNGVQVNDVRPGGDFWKWTDNIDTLTPFKLRALGISEAFLSGDASYACLAGDTLIATTEGLRRIDSFGEGLDRKKVVKINSVVDSRYGRGRAVAWQYNGYQETLRVTTSTGNTIQATGNHPLLVLQDGEHVWKRTDKVEEGDILCLSSNRTLREKTLKLDVGVPEPRKPRVIPEDALNKSGNRMGMTQGSRVEFKPGEMKVPKTMTPKMAYWLALFISEGSIRNVDAYADQEGLGYELEFVNSDERLVQRFVDLAEELFDVEPYRHGVTSAEDINEAIERTGRSSFKATKDIFRAIYRNRRLVDYLDALDVYVKPGRVDGKTASYFKVVPPCVLEADGESQLAFLAAYAECDGSIGQGTCWISKSDKLLKQIGLMLNARGLHPVRQGQVRKDILVLNREYSGEFWAEGAKYLVSKTSLSEGGRWSKTCGVPAGFWKELVSSRDQGFDRHGSRFLTDSGETIVLNKSAWCRGQWSELQKFNYRFFKEGVYDDFLVDLKSISVSAHDKLLNAFETRYKYTEVKSIVSAGKEHVYDLSMKEGTEPAFVANGLVVHNTAEAALSTFMDTTEAFRDRTTNTLFRNKFFPLIAVMHGLYRDPKEARKVRSPNDLHYNLNNHKNLMIPEVRWHKSLGGRNDDGEFDMLEKLSEKGFIVPLKMWASAAGVDISTMLRDLEEDQEIKRKIEQVTGIKTEEQGIDHAVNDGDFNDDGGDEGDDFSGGGEDMKFSAMKPPIGSVNHKATHRKIPMLARQFQPSNYTVSKSGNGIHAIVGEHRHDKKMNDMIIKASRALKDPEHRAKVRKNVLEKIGKSKIDV